MEDFKVTSFFLKNQITELNDLIFSTKTFYYENLAKKLNAKSCCKQKRIGQYLRLFIVVKNLANCNSFGRL